MVPVYGGFQSCCWRKPLTSEVSHSISLNTMELRLLDKLYMKVHIHYQELSCCYKLALKRATTSRRVTISTQVWVDSSTTYNLKPARQTFAKRSFALCIEVNKHWLTTEKLFILLLSMSLQSRRHKCSFVTVSSQESVKLCRIQQLFKHVCWDRVS